MAKKKKGSSGRKLPTKTNRSKSDFIRPRSRQSNKTRGSKKPGLRRVSKRRNNRSLPKSAPKFSTRYPAGKLSRTFRQFTKRPGRGTAQIYAVVSIRFDYGGRSDKERTFPIAMGRMSGAKAKKLTFQDIEERLALSSGSSLGTLVTVHGFAQLRSVKERKGKRIRAKTNDRKPRTGGIRASNRAAKKKKKR